MAVFVGLVLSGCGSDEAASNGATRTVEVTAKEYSFTGDPGALTEGDTIEFVLSNGGQLVHSMEVLSDEGRSLGKTERLDPGAVGSVTVTFADAGQYRLICDVDDHLSRGQVASLSVAP